MANALGFFVLLPLSAALNGYVISVLWGWFIVTTFGARPLGLLPAMGLAIFTGKLTSHLAQLDFAPKAKSAGELLAVGAFASVVRAAIYLGMGWCVHALM